MSPDVNQFLGRPPALDAYLEEIGAAGSISGGHSLTAAFSEKRSMS